MPSRSHFEGFQRPEQNWFRMPNAWVDISHGMKLAELKVIEYVLRHTWGYQEYGIPKRITLDEFTHGRRHRDGQRMDKGTGLSKMSVVVGIKEAVQHGFLIEEVDDHDKGRVSKSYALRMRPDQNLDSGVKNFDTRVQNSYAAVQKSNIRGSETGHRSEKDTGERHATVNGHQSPVRQLPDRAVSEEQVDLIAGDMVEQLGDAHSLAFYRLCAKKIPERVIRQALSEIRNDGARQPARAFTYRMNQYALGELKKGIGKSSRRA